jgi:hypothetical protein
VHSERNIASAKRARPRVLACASSAGVQDARGGARHSGIA